MDSTDLAHAGYGPTAHLTFFGVQRILPILPDDMKIEIKGKHERRKVDKRETHPLSFPTRSRLRWRAVFGGG